MGGGPELRPHVTERGLSEKAESVTRRRGLTRLRAGSGRGLEPPGPGCSAPVTPPDRAGVTCHTQLTW